jgi:hypothetical protein
LLELELRADALKTRYAVAVLLERRIDLH